MFMFFLLVLLYIPLINDFLFLNFDWFIAVP